MAYITVVNNSSGDIWVSVTAADDQGDEKWQLLNADGGSSKWRRNNWQMVKFVRSRTPGATVETVFGLVDTTVNIY